MNSIGFDNDKYLQEQTAAIHERVQRFQKLYLEFGGKLMFDYHAARVLPGYDPNVKMRLLQKLKDQADVLLCIYAGDIERKKMRADFGITYDSDALKLIDDLHEWGIEVLGVVITRYDDQPAARQFRNKLERRNVRVIIHRATRGYPTDVDLIVSDAGYGANEYVETHKPLVVVTGPGPGSGKLATCLTLLYHDHRRGRSSGYAKFETFPIWNLPLKHPVNIAYEAATADIGDYNLMDPFHQEAYQQSVVNYNRDVEVFPVLKRIFEKIMGGKSLYQSPTDMGVNRAGFGISDDALVCTASRQEVVRRYFRYACEYAMGLTESETVQRIERLLQVLGIRPEDRRVVEPARQAARAGKGNMGICCGAAIELKDGTVITGKNSPLLHAASSMILNTIKHLAEIPDKIHLLSPNITASIGILKRDILNGKAESLNLDETLVALSISSTTNPSAQMAMEKLRELSGCEMHLTHIPTPGDEAGLKRLGVNLTSDPNFPTKNLFF
ncbi:MAG: DUF1846 domain-containing protein [Verrucomicrobia bacterium]|nr:DUF1846 domain-containing protein [Verrucomicrobiota bacterium]MBU4247016.1 DUF1846 domain-containing protein [Verrucomicrobiota bacterium]MBU4290334.1 DUF1846 domain-containing protein [Verrucomicrobiota bacterium]MBU4429127.1 DUF1846 domain-containing protein [Verrucomicrobiota bacterium]MCG2681766.1 DUF1846 domain-containing protein [Kiritimatiellia bacterium]